MICEANFRIAAESTMAAFYPRVPNIRRGSARLSVGHPYSVAANAVCLTKSLRVISAIFDSENYPPPVLPVSFGSGTLKFAFVTCLMFCAL